MTAAPMDGKVRVAGRELRLVEAFAVAAGYCLGYEPVGWSPPSGHVGESVSGRSRGAFAYGTYDCIPAGPGSDLQPIDVLVADGLNAQMRARDIAGALAVADTVSEALRQLDATPIAFWELTRDQVCVEPEAETAPAWPLWRAWTLLMGVEGLSLARVHKILHHKRPQVFPLIDNQTLPRLPGGAWATIHDDLTATRDAWTWFEETLGDLLIAHHGPPITRLRIHDILLWADATGGWGTARSHGESYLRQVVGEGGAGGS